MKNYIESLLYYFDNPILVNEDLVKLKLKEIIMLLHKTDKLGMVNELISGIFNPKEIEFKEIIETHLYNNLKLEELAALCGLSLSTFKREFVKQYKSSPAKYIKQRRLEKAAELLRISNLRISDIAYDTGFQDLAHFSKSFVKVYGCPPTAYRVNHSDKSLVFNNN